MRVSALADPGSRADRGSRIEYQPGLDGLRAVSVAMVLLFHAGFGWMRGGYLGVSIFFTLSGFLITSLLLNEHRNTGKVAVGNFFARRARRLLPASLACVLLVIVAYRLGEFQNSQRLRPQLFGAVLDVFNWVQIAGDSSYSDLFSKAPELVSPLEHYWSLAIEEQFYLVWPFAVMVIVALCRRWRFTTPAGLIFAVFVIASVSAPLLSDRFGTAFAYWSTFTRLPELLAGAALAAVLAARRVPPWASRLALPASLGLVVLAVVLPSGSGPAYTGWMWPVSLVSAALILGLQAPSGVGVLLAWQPLVMVGQMSYGVYLYHWPVFVLLRQRGWDLTEPGGLLVACGLTLSLAAISYRLLEQRFRHGEASARLTLLVSTAVIAAAVLVIAALPISRGFLEPNEEVIAAAAIDPTETVPDLVTVATIEPVAASTTQPTSTLPATNVAVPTATTSTTEPPAPPPPPLVVDLPPPPNRPVRILTVGDSTAFYVGQALAEWSVANSAHARSSLLWCQGCGFILDGTITTWESEGFVQRSREVVREQMPASVTELAPDVVVLMTSVNDVTNRRWSDDEGVLTPFDELFAQRMNQAYAEVSDGLVAMGVPRIVWIRPAVPEAYWDAPEMGELERWNTMNAAIMAAAARHEQVVVVDLHDWMQRTGHADDPTWRPDGTHLTESSALQLVEEYLGPLLVRIGVGDAEGLVSNG
jgi:peptidoglycan/LPS O-acetylase OafA/YrhL/lysophospholipase L1-like esterase